ncbi:MAG: helix-hairpin-helix domain-containing protein, partial [Pseudomonadales bacterium]|nr:helix-hairpin-helix domain-containing protein [Pseudomonadales bacterium]
TILVDIGGAVLRPGIYELEAGSVVADVINSAGGFAPDANREYLNRVLNLAVELTSAQKLYIPYSGEVINRVENGSADSSTTASGNSGLISINNASQRELQTLTGIGEVRAQAIIDGRPYSSIDDLLTRRVLTEGIFRNIRDEIDL